MDRASYCFGRTHPSFEYFLCFLSRVTCTAYYATVGLDVFDWSPHPALHASSLIVSGRVRVWALASVPRDFLKAFVHTGCRGEIARNPGGVRNRRKRSISSIFLPDTLIFLQLAVPATLEHGIYYLLRRVMSFEAG